MDGVGQAQGLLIKEGTPLPAKFRELTLNFHSLVSWSKEAKQVEDLRNHLHHTDFSPPNTADLDTSIDRAEDFISALEALSAARGVAPDDSEDLRSLIGALDWALADLKGAIDSRRGTLANPWRADSTVSRLEALRDSADRLRLRLGHFNGADAADVARLLWGAMDAVEYEYQRFLAVVRTGRDPTMIQGEKD